VAYAVRPLEPQADQLVGRLVASQDRAQLQGLKGEKPQPVAVIGRQREPHDSPDMAMRLLENGSRCPRNPPAEPGAARGVAADERIDTACRERERWRADGDVAADERSEVMCGPVAR